MARRQNVGRIPAARRRLAAVCGIKSCVCGATSGGAFVKIHHPEACPLPESDFTAVEEFYSHSRQRVLRGLHFQRPPAESAKLVHCLWGRILDVVVDLRLGSPTYGRHAAFELCGERADMLFVPVGLAHGFYVVSAEALVLYKSTRAYSPQHDAGIHWASAGIAWPDPQPIVSARDGQFPPLAEYQSPFRFSSPVKVLFARCRVPVRPQKGGEKSPRRARPSPQGRGAI